MFKIKEILQYSHIEVKDVSMKIEITAEQLQDVIDGKKDFDLREARAFIEFFGVTMDYILDGIPGNRNDRKVERFIQQEALKLKQNDDLKNLKKLLSDNGLQDFSIDFYDFYTGKIDVYNLLLKNSAELYKVISENYEVLPKSWKLEMGTMHHSKVSENNDWDWHTVNTNLYKFLGKLITDTGFVYLCEQLSESDASRILRSFQNGKLRFDPKVVLYLIDCGAKLEIPNLGEGPLENPYDYLNTMLIKDLCERLIKQAE